MPAGLLTIDLGAIAANWRALDAKTDASVETAAVVKADAYGLGVTQVSQALHRAGARTFFVALACEGVDVRKAVGAHATIYVFSGYMKGDEASFADHDLIPLMNRFEQLLRYKENAPLAAYGLQLDSGMNRLGMELLELTATMRHLPDLSPQLVISHLACADEPDHPQNTQQYTAFTTMCESLPMPNKSLSATGGILLGDNFHMDMVRPGIGLYGGEPFTDARAVVTLSLPIIQTRSVLTGETVGYGAAWKAERPSIIATVAGGYADGLIRAMGSDASLYAGEIACPVVGRVSMDLITVDVTDLEDIPEALEILNDVQTVDVLAKAAGTIGYEILTSLGGRYERKYI